ncbi:hypothetical protein PYW08_003515 [Mythimna loreyi]|uniref:Uncharacterized protein n=1 Tax=Mythimna loreyi TaxID=667449 RepID=A0ACC2QV23_9NEOP|nr:hypothetical protein PYW08_003515 [Mythimna loreyi]
MVAQVLLAVKVARGEGAPISGCVCSRAPLRNLTVFSRDESEVFFPFTMKSVVLCVFVVVAAVAAAPQREGAAYTREAIKQAQSTHLIPKDAEIQKVQEGIELAAYESIPVNQRINLFEILGDQVPSEVINNLQTQIDHVGREN